MIEAVELERANTAAVPIGYLGQLLAAVNGAENPKVEDCNPYAVALKQRRAKEIIPQKVAKCFQALSKANKVPAWSIAWAELEMIRLAAS